MRLLNWTPVITFTMLIACNPSNTGTDTTSQDTLRILPDTLESIYRDFGVDATFLALNLGTGKWYAYDTANIYTRTTPASTFKIFNSLVCLEEGVLENLSDTIRWDGIVRQRQEWNHDQTMQEAFQNSTVWFYQEVARRIGYSKMMHWVSAAAYGNQDISGELTESWLTGNLRISPVEQLTLLKSLMQDSLPFSRPTMQKVKELMLIEENGNYALGGKTGWGYQDGIDYGWFVGYVKKTAVPGETWVFATRIVPKGPLPGNFGQARIEIARGFLKNLNILP